MARRAHLRSGILTLDAAGLPGSPLPAHADGTLAQARKFGTFGGVFTPSILTILGVIMYLRLPYIVGQAGLWATFGIILLAHVISIATGLSVSSIATDKRVKAGGTYYMISRSLGLPIGGTLGLALFVGMSFSVSLYLIGFSESFLSYWGLSTGINTIRIAGTIALIAVSTIALISTALALKMQYWIMGAIAVSLLSILFGRHELAPVSPLMQGSTGAEPFIVLFGIFFPAVTGFEAGVSMSGDLKDPKKSIPAGTIAAIAVGLLVYLGLAAFFAFTVSADQLTGNPRVLLDIAVFAPVVVAGIWGATISSAFGSILGAPRILQATATDGVVPAFFAHGHGRENEPRRALILAFVIAEAGILIGELNAIARIVSMFFIMAYGFLNLTATIESWVSPDFRPEFRVPRFVGLIGAIACFVVMIQLDFLAMIGASVLLFGVFLYLTRKQLRLETGDTWGGVWSALARSALLRLDRTRDTQTRNWKPNLLLFSGGAFARPHLVEFGRQLAGRRGLVTDITLVDSTASATDEGDAVDSTATRSAPMSTSSRDRVSASVAADDAEIGVFARRVACDDVYSGMEDIARYYGFAGIEPNTVLIGWGRGADPIRFTRLIEKLAERDMNVLMLDFDRDRGWGQHRRIDVWWRLTGNDVAFSLVLIRALSQADEWRDADIRFLTVNNGDPAFGAVTRREMSRVLEDFRVDAEVRVINNAFENRSFADVLRAESVDADLTVLGVDDLGAFASSPADWINETNGIVSRIGTTLLVNASTAFAEPLVRLPSTLAPVVVDDDAPFSLPGETARRLSGLDPRIADLAVTLDGDLDDALSALWEDYIAKALHSSNALATDVGALCRHAVERTVGAGPDYARAALPALTERMIERIHEARAEEALVQGGLLTAAADWLPDRVDQIAIAAPETLEIAAPASTFGVSSDTPLRVMLIQTWLRSVARIRSRPVSWTVGARELAAAHVADFAADAVDAVVHGIGADAARSILDAQRLFGLAAEAMAAGHTDDGAATTAVQSAIDEAAQSAVEAGFRLRGRLADVRERSIRNFARDVVRVDAGRASGEAAAIRSRARVRAAELQAVAAQWPDLQPLLVNAVELDVRLSALRLAVDRAAGRTRRDANAAVAGLAESLDRLRTAIEDDGRAAEHAMEIAAGLQAGFDPARVLDPARTALLDAAARLPDVVAVVADDSIEPMRNGLFEDVVSTEVALRRVVEYLVDTSLLGPLSHELGALTPALDEAAAVGREVAQFVSFRVAVPDNATGPFPDGGPDTVGAFDDASPDATSGPAGSAGQPPADRLRREIERLRQRARELDTLIDRRFAEAMHRFDAHNVVRVSTRLDEYVRGQRGREVMGGIRQTWDDLRSRTSVAAVKLIYGRSEGTLLASRLRRVATGKSGMEPLRKLVAAVSPRPDVLARLPLFYRELFLGRPTVTSDIHIGFDSELAEAKIAIEQHRKGRGGALLLLGQPGEGRVTLASLIAHQHFTDDHVFRVEPPPGGSVDVRAFNARLRAALGGTGDIDRLLAAVPGSCILIDDANLWWERSADGSAVLSAIAGMIARFGDNTLFVLDTNAPAFRLMDRLLPLEHLFIRVIACEPFNAEQLQRLVLLRHGATGFHFTYRGTPEEQLSTWQIARLFSSIFDYSAGNIGTALNAWITGITEVYDDGFELAAVSRPSLSAFDTLTRVQLMLCVQVVIHERLTLRRLQRITRLDQASLTRELRGLIRPGVLTESDNGVIRVDRFVRPHLVRYLERRELI